MDAGELTGDAVGSEVRDEVDETFAKSASLLVGSPVGPTSAAVTSKGLTALLDATSKFAPSFEPDQFAGSDSASRSTSLPPDRGPPYR